MFTLLMSNRWSKNLKSAHYIIVTWWMLMWLVPGESERRPACSIDQVFKVFFDTFQDLFLFFLWQWRAPHKYPFNCSSQNECSFSETCRSSLQILDSCISHEWISSFTVVFGPVKLFPTWLYFDEYHYAVHCIHKTHPERLSSSELRVSDTKVGR